MTTAYPTGLSLAPRIIMIRLSKKVWGNPVRNCRGVTLTELLIAVSVAAILLALAVPSFQQMIISNRITAETNSLVADLALARSEAIRRGASVTVCAASTSAGCDTSLTTDWSTGRLVFVNGTTAGQVTGGTILRYTEALKGNVTLTSANFTNNRYFQYFPSGRVDDDGTLKICHAGQTGRLVTISNTGRTETSRTGC
jgi:type IV fimbrial biogenesis protein FimT